MGATESVFLFILFFVCVLFIILVKWRKKTRMLKKIPPGPKPYPIFGNMYEFELSNPLRTFEKLQKKYGDIFTVYFGSYRVIILNNAKIIKEAFNKIELCGRPPLAPFFARTNGVPAGIMTTSGKLWMEQRDFIIKGLKEVGMNKRTTETYMTEELEILIEHLKQTKGSPITIDSIFTPPILNVVWRIISGQRFDYDDPKLDILIKGFTANLSKMIVIGPVFFFPWICKLFPKISGWNKFIQGIQPALDVLNNVINSHKTTFTNGQTPQDFIDFFYQKILNTTDPHSSFFKEKGDLNMAIGIQDLFIVSSQTTSTILSWAFLCLARHSAVQEIIRQEINAVDGNGKVPSLKDRIKMPYTEAFILEVLRFSAISPLGAFHWATEDTEIDGYLIPKDTVIVSNLYSVAMDERVWKDPHKFQPERFLSENGKKVIYHEHFIAFSTGKRSCIGEAIAKDQIFLFITTVLKHFKVETTPEFPIDTIEWDFGAILIPKNYPVAFRHIEQS